VTKNFRLRSFALDPLMKPQYIYLAGVKYLDPCDRQWTAAEIDAVYDYLGQTSGHIDRPPNKRRYPLNILGYSKYSITKTGRPRENKFNYELEGSVQEAAHNKLRFTMTNDDGEEVEEYACELVAKMFFPPPLQPRLHQHDRDTLSSDISNKYWHCDEPIEEPAVKKLSAKSVQIKTNNGASSIQPLAASASPPLPSSLLPQTDTPASAITDAAMFTIDMAVILQRVKQIDDKTVRPTVNPADNNLPLPFTQWEEDEEQQIKRMEESLRPQQDTSDDEDDNNF
jgi:hypothetical protein